MGAPLLPFLPAPLRILVPFSFLPSPLRGGSLSLLLSLLSKEGLCIQEKGAKWGKHRSFELKCNVIIIRPQGKPSLQDERAWGYRRETPHPLQLP